MNQEVLDVLKCALSDKEHFLIKPIPLKCGHCVCRNCILNEKIKEIKCNICNIVSEQDFNTFLVSKTSQQALKFCIVDIFQMLEEETSNQLNELKDKIKIKGDILDVTFNYIEEEIDIRIESVKVEVENVGNRVKRKVQDIRRDFFNSSNEEEKLNDFEESLKNLQENIEKRINLNEDYLDNYQNKMKELKTLITEIDDYKIPLVKISTDTVEDSLIGRFYSIKRNNNKMNILDLLKIENKEYIELDYYPIHLTVISNNRLLVLNYFNDNEEDYTQCITLHDQNYNLIQKIEKINGETLLDLGEIAINQEKGELYLLDKNNDRIIVTDMELDFIKYFDCVDHGDEFDLPLAICFKNENLYVCDSGNKRIQIFDSDLEYIESLELGFSPYRVQTSNSMLAVTSDDGIYFYDLSSLDFQNKFDNEFKYIPSISEIDSMFYYFDCETKEFSCFDQNGNLIEDIYLNEISLTRCFDGKLILFNKNLLMSSYEGKKLIKFR